MDFDSSKLKAHCARLKIEPLGYQDIRSRPTPFEDPMTRVKTFYGSLPWDA